jgi:putative FmdB family regulatory protein
VLGNGSLLLQRQVALTVNSGYDQDADAGAGTLRNRRSVWGAAIDVDSSGRKTYGLQDSEEDAMPIYEYYCQQCQREFEVMRPFSESALPARCPGCGADVAKVPSVFASNEGYSVKVPSGPAYRRKQPDSAANRPPD